MVKTLHFTCNIRSCLPSVLFQWTVCDYHNLTFSCVIGSFLSYTKCSYGDNRTAGDVTWSIKLLKNSGCWSMALRQVRKLIWSTFYRLCLRVLTRTRKQEQCDQMVKLCFNIWPNATMKISPVMQKICQSKMDILPKKK